MTPWNSMELCGIRWKIFHGILWSSTETKFHGILSGIGTWNSMEFYENIIYEIYGVPQKLNSMEFCLVLGLQSP